MAEYLKWDGTTVKSDETECVAKSTNQGYFIKVCKDGIERGRFFNAQSEFNDGSVLGAKIRHSGLPMYEYQKVAESVYANYKNYLSSKNKCYLNVAEREAFHG